MPQKRKKVRQRQGWQTKHGYKVSVAATNSFIRCARRHNECWTSNMSLPSVSTWFANICKQLVLPRCQLQKGRHCVSDPTSNLMRLHIPDGNSVKVWGRLASRHTSWMCSSSRVHSHLWRDGSSQRVGCSDGGRKGGQVSKHGVCCFKSRDEQSNQGHLIVEGRQQGRQAEKGRKRRRHA